jgi:3(or 17)beta-hydroxysteroid dehydrogenase
MTDRLKNKCVLITGGACGIGKAHALLFAQEGAAVVITTNKKITEGHALAEEIRQRGGEAIFMQLDVTNEVQWQQVINEVVAKYGKLNVLVNNAGISLGKTIEDTTLAEWNNIMNTNATGVFLGTKYAIAAMKQNGEPCSIINISSIDAMIGEAPLAAYCASKGATRSLTKSAALSCAEAGYPIRVNSVHPGYIHTELTEKEAQDSGMTPEQYFAKVGALHPIGHIGKPMDVAYLSLYLAADESRWVTGAEMVVDGGYIAR